MLKVRCPICYAADMLTAVALVAMLAPTPWCQKRPDSWICKKRCKKDAADCPPNAQPEKEDLASFDPADWGAETIGAQANEHFRRFRETCNLAPPDEKLSSIPRNVASEISPADGAVVLTKDSGGEAFMRLFDEDDVNRLKTSKELGPESDPKKRVVVSVQETELLPAPSGASNVAYVQSCASMASADAELGVKWGPAELNSALEAESKRKSEIILIDGVFYSPLAVLLNGNAAEKRAAHLALWASRRNFAGQAASTLRYLQGFTGMLILRSASREMSTRFNVEGSAEGSFAVVKAKIAAEAGFERASDLSFASYSSHIRSSGDGLAEVFAPLPELEKMKESAAEGARSAVTSGTEIVTIGGDFPVAFSKTVYGIPRALCNRDEWLLDSSSLSAGLTVTKHEVEEVEAERFACKFSVVGQLDTKSVNRAAAQPVSAMFGFVAGSGDTALRLPFSTTVNTSDDPRPEPPQAKVSASMLQQGEGVEYRWRFQLRFSGEDFRADYGRGNPKLKKAELKCPKSQMTLSGDAEVRVGKDKRDFTIEVVSHGTGKSEEYKAADQACEFSSEIVFPILDRKSKVAGRASRFFRVQLVDYERIAVPEPPQ